MPRPPLILGRRQLKHVLRVYVQHYGQRPHRSLDLSPPEASNQSAVRAALRPRDLQVNRRDLLGGLIHEYDIAVVA